MVMVPGERKLVLTLIVVRNYSVPQLQPANLRNPRLQARDYTIGNGGRAVPELGYHVGQTSRPHTD